MEQMGKAREFTRNFDDHPNPILNADREEHGRVRRAFHVSFSLILSFSSLPSPILWLIKDNPCHLKCALRFIDAPARGRPVKPTSPRVTGGRMHTARRRGMVQLDDLRQHRESYLQGSVPIVAKLSVSPLDRIHLWDRQVGIHHLVSVLHRFPLAGANSGPLGGWHSRPRQDGRVQLSDVKESIGYEGRETKPSLRGVCQATKGMGSRFRQAGLLILAGSETTAAALSRATYVRLSRPDVLATVAGSTHSLQDCR